MLLVVFKIVGILMSGVLGVLSSVLKIRDASGQFTVKGKVFIAGSVAGLCIALISQILETYIQRQSQAASQAESLESTRKLQQIMLDLNRTLQPLGKFSVFVYRANVSLEDTRFDSYKKRLDKLVLIHLKKSERERMMDKDISTITGYMSGGGIKATALQIRPDGKYYPSYKDDKDIGLLSPICYKFVFFREPIDPSKYQPMHHYGDGLGDLRADAFMPKPLALIKDLSDGSFSLGGMIEFRDWEDVSGKVVSIPDLVGSQLFISACSKPMRGWTWVGKKKIYHEPIDTKFEMGTMMLHFEKRKMWVKKSELNRFERKGEVYWEYRFPDTQEALGRRLAGSDPQ